MKTNYEVIGLNAKATVDDCKAQLNKEIWTESILSWAQKSCEFLEDNLRITKNDIKNLKIELKSPETTKNFSWILTS